MSDFSADQIESLFSAMEQNPKLQARMNALFAIKGEGKGSPLPDVTGAPSTSVTVTSSSPSGLNSGKVTKEKGPEDASNIDAVPQAPIEKSSDLLALVKDYSLPRHIIHVDNMFVPDLSACFQLLHHMDEYIIDVFKARRACLTLSPIHNRIWFTLLVNVQVARCLDYANYLDSDEDAQALQSFLKSYPPEKLHIPGPLLPFFKAICTYKVQNELHKRVSPRFPKGAFDSTRTSSYDVAPAFPELPLTVALLTKYSDLLTGTFDPKKDLNSGILAKPYVFEWKNKDDHSEGYKNDVKLAGFTFKKNVASWTVRQAYPLAIPSLRHPLELNEDVASNIKSYGKNYQCPQVPEDYTVSNLAEFLCITKKKWVASFLRPMASYAALWTGSGTLADCQVDGPAAGAYVFNYSTSEDTPKQPTMPFDKAALFDLNGKVWTTEGSPSPVAERLAIATRIHTRGATDNPSSAYYTSAVRRFGTVWNQDPKYGPSSEDYLYDSIEEVIPRFVQPKLV